MIRPPERITTDRLQLARWHPDDAAQLRAALDASNAHLRPWIPFMRHEPRSLTATRQWLEEIAASWDAGEHFRYAIWLHGTDTLVGETMLLRRGPPGTLEAGYWLHVDHCGHGYAAEATGALLPVAFTLPHCSRIAIVCDERNAASIAVARRLGAVPFESRDVVEHGANVRLSTFEFRLSPRPDAGARRAAGTESTDPPRRSAP